MTLKQFIIAANRAESICRHYAVGMGEVLRLHTKINNGQRRAVALFDIEGETREQFQSRFHAEVAQRETEDERALEQAAPDFNADECRVAVESALQALTDDIFDGGVRPVNFNLTILRRDLRHLRDSIDANPDYLLELCNRIVGMLSEITPDDLIDDGGRIPDPVGPADLASIAGLSDGDDVSRQLRDALKAAKTAQPKRKPGERITYTHMQLRKAYPHLRDGKLKDLLRRSGIANLNETGIQNNKPEPAKRSSVSK